MEDDGIQAREGHERDQRDLDPTQEVLYQDAGFQETPVDDGDDGQEPEGQGLLGEFGGLDAKGEEHVLAEDDAVAGGEPE